MDMAPVHNREARPPSAAREHPDPPRVREETPLVKEQPEAAVRAKRTEPVVELAQPKGPGFQYESGRLGVEVVLYNKSDGSVAKRIPVRRRMVEPTDLDMKA